MDTVNNWKRILLQWIKECNFLEKPFNIIEHSDIEGFFIKFRNQLKNDGNSTDLPSFLKEHYPLFEPHFDDENGLSYSDYVYVYSLMLHFSCVKCPDVFFQKKCQQLNETSQQNITTFFKKLLEANFLTKETLRHAIASITLFPSPNPRLICMESPGKTPQKSEISPPTPRSSMLQERNKKLHNMKVQLDNEIYEKGLLEIEIKQNQEKISKLSRELKRSHQEIQNLKNDLLSTNMGSDSEARHSEEEQLNRRLCKQISQKEVEISKLLEENDVLAEQNHILKEKQKHAEKQLKEFQNKFDELALKVDDLTGELEQKDLAIQNLSETKWELEHYISEVRSSSASSRPDLNISVECLDVSRTTNSSGSINSPENLGCSVVDIQLREKENENMQLRDEIAAIRSDNAKLSKHMCCLTLRYSKLFDICNENLIIDQESVDPVANFMLFSNYVEKFVNKYERNCVAFKDLKESTKAIEEQNRILSGKVAETESEVVNLRNKIDELKADNDTLETAKTRLENIVDEWQKKVELNVKERLEVAQNFENLQKELENVKISKNDTDQMFKQQIKDLEENLEINQERFEKFKIDSESKDMTLKGFESELIEIKIKNQNLMSQIEQLNAEFECEKTNMKSRYDSGISLLEEKLKESSKLLYENERKIQEFESEKQNYENKILNLRSECSETENRFLKEINTKEYQLQESTDIISVLKKEKSCLVTELSEAKRNCDSLLNEVEKNKKNIFFLKRSLCENKEALQKSADYQNEQYLIISKLQTEKETLINLIQGKVDALRIAVDRYENYFRDKLSERDEQNAVVMNKLVCIEAELKLRQIELENISSKHKFSERVVAERTEHFFNVMDKLKRRVQVIIEQIDTKTITEDFEDENWLLPVSSDSTDAVNSLKEYLNTLVRKLQQIILINAKNEKNVANLSESVQKLTQQNTNFEHKISLSERRICELREDLASESQCEINKLTNEVSRLNDDICNLENVCDHLTEENSSLQVKLSKFQSVTESLTKENRLLKAKASALEADHATQLSVAEKLINTETELRAQVVNMQLSVKRLETDIDEAQRLLLVKTQDAERLLEESHEAECTIESMKKQILDLQTQVLILNTDLNKMIAKFEAAEKFIKQNSEEYCRELEDLKVQLETKVIEKNRVKEELENANNYLNDLENQKNLLENKCQLLDMQLEKSKNDLELTKTELTRFQSEETRLLGEIEQIKKANLANETQVEDCNKKLVEHKENVSRLIKEISSIRREKDHLEEEKRVLLKSSSSLEAYHKSIVEKLQLTEKDLLAKENSIKAEQLKSQDLENQLRKLQTENRMLKETGENNTKRIEKQALKLGETQAKSLRLKKEAETAQNSFEVLKYSTEAIQRENNKLSLECKNLKEKLSKSEKAFDQLESNVQMLKKSNEVLRLEKGVIETSENELKSTNKVLEKNKANLEEKIRKLTKTLSDSNVVIDRLEQENVQLNLEVGGLNTRLQESKSLLSMKLKEVQEATNNLIEAKSENMKLIQLNEQLEVDAIEIREENSRLNDHLSKLELRLKINQEEYETTKAELEFLRADIAVQKSERDVIEKEHIKTLEHLKEMELLVEKRHTTQSEFVDKINLLESQISEMSSDFRNMEELLKQEKQTNEKLNKDISILQAKLQKSRSICEENEKKWNEEKDQLLMEVQASDERIKETRLELEGKLEKMKNKMKTLYNDEVTKMKKKQERELAAMKTKLDALKDQSTKYEEHTKKLSSQIFRLNENILEHQKQNTFLKTKVQDLESKPRQFSRITSSHAPQSSAHQALSSNLHMEDEEGEIFNNTYLSDLKTGRMSEVFSRDICAQELQYRNSLLPPHLKSTYLAQFDHQMEEDEIRETPSLDDSLSTLLNTGQRKKVSGATSYKRPGPPTPSKNAGRLSFGGNGELNREILKETPDMGHGPSSSKTPAKFKLFSSRLSMRDECKNYVMNFKRKQHILGAVQCSSTPRKSKAHFDQRRLLDQIMSIASPGPDDSVHSPAINPPSTLKSVELNRRKSKKWRESKYSCVTTDSGTSDVNSRCKDVKYESVCQRLRRLKDRRGSIYLRGSMFARNCRTPNLGFREVFKRKSKIQRYANFNKFRGKMVDQLLVEETSIWRPCAVKIKNNAIEDSKDNNLSSHDSVSGDENNDKSSKHFQQLLIKKESQAPFEISEIKSPSYLNVNGSSSTIHSRTIYGASVILNRKIPNVNTTLVRKSSIYVKANEGHGVILITNQTITLTDLAQMWIQMNASAKIVIEHSSKQKKIEQFI